MKYPEIDSAYMDRNPALYPQDECREECPSLAAKFDAAQPSLF
jgi:hypothetical protein